MSEYADLTNLSEILKNVYGDGLKNQFNDEVITYNQFPKSERKPVGNGYIFGVRYARAQGTGGRAESAKLPDPLTGKKDQAKITPVYQYGSIRLTGPAIEIAKGNTAAFVDGLADEMDDIYQSIIVDLNRQCHWDGWGQLGRLSAATISATTTWAGTFDNDIGVMYMQEGQLVDFFVSAGTSPVIATTTATCAVGIRVNSLYPSTKIAIFEAANTSYSANHPHFSGYGNAACTMGAGVMAIKMGTRDASWATASDTAVELTGLTGIFDDGTNIDSFQNINADTYSKWRANVLSNSSVNRELSIDLMLNAVDLGRFSSGKKVKNIRMGLGQRRKYANLLMPDVRFAPTVLKGGYETLTFSGGDGSLSIIVDPMQQPNMVFFEPDGVIQKFEVAPLGWGNLDGSNMHRRSGYDEWDLFLRLYTNLGVDGQRNSLCKLSDLVEPSLY